jgi:hypothetical protein
MPSNFVANRTFLMSDQEIFGSFSADINPIHVDPVFARRTISGECIVHGIHGVMWALEYVLKKYNLHISRFEAEFLKPITLGQEVVCSIDLEQGRILLEYEKTTFTRIQFTSSENLIPQNIELQKIPRLLQAEDRTFSNCSSSATQMFGFSGDEALATILFPKLIQSFGLVFVCELAATSEIVGMRIPGLHSLFSGIEVTYTRSNNNHPVFKTIQADERIGLLNLSVEATSLTASVRAFFRTPPTESPTIFEIEKSILKNEFSGVRALIVGGSRGLGELTAKIISAGGGEVTITYHTGRSDAESVQKQINEFGGVCNVAHLTADGDFIIHASNFNQIYFFATPKIAAESASSDNSKIYESYHKVYVQAFERLCSVFVDSDIKISVFYPSTTFLDSDKHSFPSYARAKLEGEELCEKIMKTTNIKILAPRLPRLETDQTLSIYKSKFPDPVEVFLPYIREMTAKIK